MQGIKLVFIDWNQTLSTSKFWEHLEIGSKEELELFNKIENCLFTKNAHLINPWMKGEFNSEKLVAKISGELTIDFKFVFNEFVKGCEIMKFVSTQIPQLVKSIQSKGMKVYIATHNMDSFNRWTVPAMKLDKLFNGVINSYFVKAFKHDFNHQGESLFFHDVIKKEKVTPSEVYWIDDSDDKDNLLTNYGVNYKRVDKENTVVEALRSLAT